MKIRRPLQSPQTKSKEQIELVNLSHQDKLVNSLSFFRREIQKNSEIFRLNSTNQDFFSISHIVSTIFFTFGFLYVIFFHWDRIPLQISFLYINLEGTWLQISKEYFSVVVLCVLLLNIIIYMLTKKIKKNKNESFNLLSLIASVTLILFAIAVIQILRLVLV